FFETLEENAIARADGTVRMGPDGEQLPVYVLENGVDLNQMIQKFLTGAIAFHQGADDYLDSDTEGKGLLADTAVAEGQSYTGVEHAWDEAFGYFGASRDYFMYTDDELAGAGGRPEYGSGYHDTDGDGQIDLLTEFNFGHAVNAAKRDRGSNVPTDFTAEAYNAFFEGRAILAAANGEPLNPQFLMRVETLRDRALLAWEKAIASTVVHYINDTLQVMNAFGTDDYDFLDHAKFWSEMKGFALVFQFNPFSPITDDQFDDLHELMGDAPVLADAGSEAIDAYKVDLLSARDILQQAYAFDEANMGDENGENGW
ncbi:MAG: DUF4856 domain-containing protein, partial [Myxococcota bacterium]